MEIDKKSSSRTSSNRDDDKKHSSSSSSSSSRREKEKERRPRSRSREKKRDKEERNDKEERGDRKKDKDKEKKSSSSSSKTKKEEEKDNNDEEEEGISIKPVFEVPSGKIEMSVNSNGEYELSIEQQNKVRISLGLKPLKVETEEEKKEKLERQRKEAEEREKKKKSLEVKAKLEGLKEDRQYRSMFTTPSLGQSSGKEDALSWVTKQRNLQKEKELAEKRAQELREIEANFETQEDQENYKVSGLKVAHDLKDFLEVQKNEKLGEVILTFKDSNVLLDTDNLNDEEGELENISLVEKEKLDRKLELLGKKKKTFLFMIH